VKYSNSIADRSKAGIAVGSVRACQRQWLGPRAVHVAVLLTAAAVPVMGLQPAPDLDEAKRLFYNAQYAAAAEMALEFLPANPDEELERDEFRAAALLFQLRGLLEPAHGKKTGKGQAVERCEPCRDLIARFMTSTSHGQRLARARLVANPADATALFFLGKLDLHYVWLQLGPLHRKTGWHEYWEARRSIDAVLATNPRHVRARVARAWIDYIVDTKMPWGARWLLGGGDKKRALAALREAAASDADFFAHAEAEFALWDMLVRERQVVEASGVAERLANMFPANPEVAKFLEARRQ
jgi:tetratricopeptide (TPR) repeat protein